VKKYVIGAVFFVLILGLPAFAFEGRYLITYPRAFPANNLTLSAGFGINTPTEGNMTIPPILLTADYALPIGGLPFSIGGIFGIYGSERRTPVLTNSYTQSWLYINFGARLGYHFNWGVDKLDTYALTTLGWTSYSSKATFEDWPAGIPKPVAEASTGAFLWGISVGARYFFAPNLGAFLEMGYSTLSFLSLGISFKL
jgi:hypothetical protein